MMCDRCDEVLRPGEGETVPMFGASGAGSTVVVHKQACQPPRSRAQSYPVERR